MSAIGRAWNAVRWRLAASRRLWRPGAKPEMTFLESGPFDLVPRGQIDGPGAGVELERGRLAIGGWVVFPSEPTARVEIWLGEELLGRARLGQSRPDLEELFRNPAAIVAGFGLIADLTEWEGPDGETTLRAMASSAAGERFELAPVPLVVLANEAKRSTKSIEPPPPDPTPLPTAGKGPRLLVFTHQLNLGGGQLYLMDVLRELTAQGLAQPTVVSMLDGVLREELEAMGIPVHVSGMLPVDDLGGHIGRLEELAAWAKGREFEVAFVNTATVLSFPGAILAAKLGIPVVWAIHESFSPAMLWDPLDPPIRKRAMDALAEADVLVFEAEATQRLFERQVPNAQVQTLPYGLDFEPIDAARAAFDRDAARREANIPSDAEVILCIGTIEPRKAQVVLAQAFGMIAEHHPRAELVFVGGRDDRETEVLEEYLAASPSGERTRIVPVTPDTQPWYGMADLLVCASDIESLPRTVLEAMAWETPVLATDVFGLPELIDDGETGWLCEASDTLALAAGLDRALSAQTSERERIGAAARRLVEERHSLPEYARTIAKLIENAAAKTAANAHADVAAG
jgi:D-inositol-3-phosphate glycosyltransferase